MNSTIILSINGYKRNILRYNYSFSRKVDCKGRPTTGLQGGDIDIEMESDGDSSILDMMLADMNKSRQAFFFHNEPIPVSGKIQHIKDDMMFRELAFDEAYLYSYGEKMTAEGSEPMITRFLISPTRLDINRTVRLDRRTKTTYGFWWEEYKEEKNNKVIIVNKEELPIRIIDAYWIDDNKKEQRNLNMEKPVTLYVKVDNPVIGKIVELSFEDGENELRTATYSGEINNKGIIVLENFKMDINNK